MKLLPDRMHVPHGASATSARCGDTIGGFSDVNIALRSEAQKEALTTPEGFLTAHVLGYEHTRVGLTGRQVHARTHRHTPILEYRDEYYTYLIFGKLTAKSHNLSGLDLVNRTRWVKEIKCRVPRNQTLHAIHTLDSCTLVLFYILIF